MRINFRRFPAILTQWDKLKKRLNVLFKKPFLNKLKKQIHKGYFAYYLRAYLFLFFIILAGILLQLLVYLNSVHRIARAEQRVRNEEYKYWSGVAFQFPNVPDVLYNASLSALNIGDKDKALEYIERAISIDPLFERAYILKREILR